MSGLQKKKLPRTLKLAFQGLPLAGAALTALLPIPRLGQQFVMLIVLLWIQIFFMVEAFVAGK
jgi:hypothetical protein